MNLKLWRIPEHNEAKASEFCKELGCRMPLARILISRGFASPGEAADFLDCAESPCDPLIIADMQKAASRIRHAVQEGERIEIFGDYDVDGITSTALLFEYLESIGADVFCSLPVREGDGYGLSKSMVDRMAADGVSLIITVDNGVSANEAVEYAQSIGIDVVVTDHHKVPETLPMAAAVVDPLRADDPSPFKELAGVGVALKLVAAIDGCKVSDMMEPFGAYAALGTVSDVMPLISENRYIVKNGLNCLKVSDNLGLQALAQVCGAELANIDTRCIAFTLAPKLNAAGRMSSADSALELLLTDDPERALELANHLQDLNSLRQQTEREMVELIQKEIEAHPELQQLPALIFSSENYVSGVSGIVCSRLAEKYGKPTIIISVADGAAKGSGRGVDGSSLYEAVASASDLLTRFGGHDMAAGFTMAEKDLPEFKDRIIEYYRRRATEVHVEEYKVDAVAEFSEFRESEVRELLRLAPFGASNPEPVFATLGARVEAINPLNDRHCRLTLSKGGSTITGVMFGKLPAAQPFKVGDLVDVAYCVSIYQSPRGSMVSYRICSLQPAGLSAEAVTSVAEYNAMQAGGKLPSFTLTREKVGGVYKELRRRGRTLDNAESYAFIFARCCELGAAVASVDVLEELGLLRVVCTDGLRYIEPVPDPEKKDLSASALFQKLS